MPHKIPDSSSFFSEICTDQCGGRCCAPWWGIVSYTLKKDGGLSGFKSFGEKILKSIKEREKRIRENYITKEVPPRSLFVTPERYNVGIENIKIDGSSFLLTLRAMFAFRCLFLSEKNECIIHPALTGAEDIRPPHCGYMGSIEAKEGEKGFCRIVHAAAISPGDKISLEEAIKLESLSSETFLKGGCDTAEEAAQKVSEEIKTYCLKNAPHLSNTKVNESKPGRNDPCWCGSGKKYKKCHG